MKVNKSEDRSDTFEFQNTGEHTPVMYPRSNAERVLSDNNKGAASVDAGPGVVDCGVGPYPKGIEIAGDEADTEGSGTA